MNKENLPTKEYKNWDDNLIIDILKIEMRGLSLIGAINNQCEKQVSIGSIYPVLGRLELQKYITSRMFEPGNGEKGYKLFKATREGGMKIYQSNQAKQIQAMRGNLGGLAGA